jgi:hypothetical protein
MGNVLISNVPGPSKALYMMGAKMDKCFPISVLPPGMSLNITLYSYNGSIHVGLVACRSALPDLTELASYIDDAFTSLENEVLDSAIETVTDHIQLLSSSSQHSDDIKKESVEIISKTANNASILSPRPGVDIEDSRLCETV